MSNNSFGGKVSQRREDQWEAYEKLSPMVRDALKDSLGNYCTVTVLAYYRNYGGTITVQWLREGDKKICESGLIPKPRFAKRGTPPAIPSTACKPCRVSILRGNWK